MLPSDPFIPAGDYDTWTNEQSIHAELVARLYALEYVKDFDNLAATIRLGVDPDLAPKVTKRLKQHWLVAAYVSQLQDRYVKDALISQDRIVSLLVRDASNFGQGSNSMARVTAQKTLVQVMGMDKTADKQAEALEKAGKGGVMFVPLFTTEDEWERIAMANQRKIREEADSDDVPEEGAELL